MQVLYERCAGIDVHKDQVTVAVRTPGSGPGRRDTQVRKFGAFYGVLRDMTRWLAGQGVTCVAMEATGIYTMPVYHALLETGSFQQVLVCHAAHVKNVPGRKTDAVDASWLAELLECGLLRGSFMTRRTLRRSATWSATGARSCRSGGGDPAARRGAPGRRDQAGLGGLLH